MAGASVHLMQIDKAVYDAHTEPMQSHINVGYGSEVTIAQLAQTIGQTVGYQGEIIFDITKPDGSPRKLIDSSCLNILGWEALVPLAEGLVLTYQDFLKVRSWLS